MRQAVLARKSAVSSAPQSSAAAKATSSGLRISEPDDKLEQEADWVANEVMSRGQNGLEWSLSRVRAGAALQRKCACGGSAGAEEECEECKKKGTLQRRAAGSGVRSQVPRIVNETLRSLGQTLDRHTRAFFESRFAHDFGGVRVHTDARAAESALAVNALAYTLGNHIVFAPGHYDPHRPPGRSLLAHELAHVVQQSNAPASRVDTLLPTASSAEQEAKSAARSLADVHTPRISQRISASQLSRQEKPGGMSSSSPGATPQSGTPSGASGGKLPQRLRFDILGADTALSDFLAKEAGLSRDPDLRVTSLEDLISQLEKKAPPNSGRCVEHISVFNHGNPFGQPVAGEGKKKVAIGGTPGKLQVSGFYLPWLFNPAHQEAVARLRHVFCCDAEMHWVGCTTAGVIAYGGKRWKAEVAASEERFEDEFFRNEYRSVEEALAHHANLQGAIFGQVNVQTWADATCTSIRAANDFVYADYNNPAEPFKPIKLNVGDNEYKGDFLLIKPSSAGQCSCDSTSGRVQGKWMPGQGIDVGDPKWQADLKEFNQAMLLASDSEHVNKSLFNLLADIRPSLTIPAGLPVGDKLQPHIMGPSVISYTYDHLFFCYPNDSWKWIGVSPFVIQGTPAFTRTHLNHELLHASEIYAAAKKFQETHGPPPTPPAGACTPSFRPSSSEPYGKYVLDFQKFYSEAQTPHLEIYATSAAKEFQHFTPAEKVDWFSDMLTAVPADVPHDRPLATEGLVNGVFQNPLASEQEMRIEFGKALFLMTRGFIYGTEPAPLREKNIGKAKTLMNHFLPAWNVYRPGDKRTLSEGIRMESGG
jgi:hypothetical protein